MVVVKDVKTGGLGIDTTVEDAFVSDPGQYVGKTLQSVAGMTKTVPQAVENLTQAGISAAQSVIENLTGNGEDGVPGDYQRKLMAQELALQTKIDSDLKDALRNQGADTKRLEQELQELGQKALATNGVQDPEVKVKVFRGTQLDKDKATVVINGVEKDKRHMKGFYDPDSKTVFINADLQDGTSETLLGTFANELSHRSDAAKGKAFNNRRQDVSNQATKELQSQFAGYNGTENVNRELYLAQLDAQDMSRGNVLAEEAKEAQPSITAGVAIAGALLVANATKTDTDNAEWESTKGILKDTFLSATGLKLGKLGRALSQAKAAVEILPEGTISSGKGVQVKGAPTAKVPDDLTKVTHYDPSLGLNPAAQTNQMTGLVEGTGREIVSYYPPNDGALGATERMYLMPGEIIDRFGTPFGKYASPENTPIENRALPSSANTDIYSKYQVEKPLEVEKSITAPAFNQPGLGTQYKTPVSIKTLLERKIIKKM